MCNFSHTFIWSETWRINKSYCAMLALTSACSVIDSVDMSVDPTTAGVPSAMSALIMPMSI